MNFDICSNCFQKNVNKIISVYLEKNKDSFLLKMISNSDIIFEPENVCFIRIKNMNLLNKLIKYYPKINDRNCFIITKEKDIKELIESINAEETDCPYCADHMISEWNKK